MSDWERVALFSFAAFLIGACLGNAIAKVAATQSGIFLWNGDIYFVTKGLPQ